MLCQFLLGNVLKCFGPFDHPCLHLFLFQLNGILLRRGDQICTLNYILSFKCVEVILATMQELKLDMLRATHKPPLLKHHMLTPSSMDEFFRNHTSLFK